MEKIFGEVDFVEAGENETSAEKIEAVAYSTAHGDLDAGGVEMTAYGKAHGADEKPTVLHKEDEV